MAEYSLARQGARLGARQGSHDQHRRPGQGTGAAKYSYDINPDKMLLARAARLPARPLQDQVDRRLGAPRRCRAWSAVSRCKKVGDEIRWQGDPIAVVAGESEGAVAEGSGRDQGRVRTARRVRRRRGPGSRRSSRSHRRRLAANVQLEKEPADDDDEDEFDEKEIERLFKESAAVVEGYYGIDAITHMCLEPHGSTCEWKDDKLTAHLSTQNVSGTAGQFAGPLGITADDVTVHCDYIGGGFGSKFAADRWGVLAAKIAKETGPPGQADARPRPGAEDRRQSRPAGFIKVKVGADKDGVVKVWDSHHWGTSGVGGGGVSQAVIPYVFDPQESPPRGTTISTNTGPSAGLAGAESSASLRDDADGLRRHRGQAGARQLRRLPAQSAQRRQRQGRASTPRR